MNHPAWCSPRLCDVTDATLPTNGGSHRSEPIRLDSVGLLLPSGTARVVEASICQVAQTWPTSTYLVIKTDRGEADMPISQAAAVLTQLGRLIDRGEAAA